VEEVAGAHAGLGADLGGGGGMEAAPREAIACGLHDLAALGLLAFGVDLSHGADLGCAVMRQLLD